MELVAAKQVSVQQAGDITIPGRKLLDIFKSQLPEKTSVTLSTEGERIVHSWRAQPLHAVDSSGRGISGHR